MKQSGRVFPASSDYIESGIIRQKETLRALQLLGLSGKQAVFLGYPDRGLKDIWEQHWENSRPYLSEYTNCDRSPYQNSFQVNAPYTGEALLANLEQILDEFQPTIILLPHREDRHSDHRAAWDFCATALTKQAGKIAAAPTVFMYLVHHSSFPKPRGYHPEATLWPPKQFSPRRGYQWRVYALSTESLALKEQAIKEYKSQLELPLMPTLFYSFIRRYELYEEVPVPVLGEDLMNNS